MDSDHLSMMGNCIIAGLWHIMPDLRETIVAVLDLFGQSSKMHDGPCFSMYVLSVCVGFASQPLLCDLRTLLLLPRPHRSDMRAFVRRES
jgi:hypothetical protein